MHNLFEVGAVDHLPITTAFQNPDTTPFAQPDLSDMSGVLALGLGLTGIPLVDLSLVDEMPHGGLVLVAGPTNVENTILASQIASRLVNISQSVLMVSTWASKQDVTERMMASATGWPHDELEGGRLHFVDTPTLQIPYDRTRSAEFTQLAIVFNKRMDKHLEFHLRLDFKSNPLAVLNEVLDSAAVPGCLMLNDLRIDGFVGGPGKLAKVDMPAEAASIMQRLAEYAHEHGIPVVVFCQQSHDALTSTRKRVRPSQIAEYPGIGKLCDVFIGISQVRSQAAKIQVDGSTSPAQYFNLQMKGHEDMLMPVAVNYDLQQYTAREETDIKQVVDLRRSAAEMVLSSKHHGFVLFRRAIFEKLCELNKPDCINVFAMCLLVAEKKKHQYGTMRYGKQKIGELLGIERHRVAVAINLLEKIKLLRWTGKKNGRAKIYEIISFKETQEPGIPGYFMLAHNLRDPQRKDLLGDPLLFRVWLGVIYRARYSPDDDMLERGQLHYNAYELAELLGDEVADIDSAIERLLARGSLKIVELEFYETQVLEITNYELYGEGESYTLKNARKCSTK